MSKRFSSSCILVLNGQWSLTFTSIPLRDSFLHLQYVGPALILSSISLTKLGSGSAIRSGSRSSTRSNSWLVGWSGILDQKTALSLSEKLLHASGKLMLLCSHYGVTNKPPVSLQI
ncbi:hypothetical protein VZT92_010580 [Zoarces viviparus]|uniref:Uncharacterized protein n=1 Tax=Zoarces viviparus TaxID=48416 RepID=A0AAW1F926_ZOAVI